MPKKEMHFMGLLANIDPSILNVKLDHGFKIHAISDKKGVDLLSIFEHLPVWGILEKLLSSCCLSDKKLLYCIDNSFESDIEMDDEE